jgi:transmembrane sensor
MHWSRIAGIAAVAMLTVTAGSWLARAKRVASTPPVVAVQMQEYTTARGQLASIFLGDGTRVVLAPESRLRVPKTIGQTASGVAPESSREVTLEGNAFFDVVHDERRPFVVRTAAGIARDLGTSFEVRAYAESRSMRVTVVSGIVSLHRPAREPASTSGIGGENVGDTATLATLTRGDRATLPVGGPITLARNVDLGPTLAWTKGSLVFRGMRLDEVATELSRWYDLDVRLGDSTVANERLVLTVQNEPAAATLNLIALSLKLRVERNGRVVTLLRLDEKHN